MEIAWTLTGRKMAFLQNVLSAITKLGLFISAQIRFTWTGYNAMSKTWTFFTDEEVAGLDKELVAMLDYARGRAGVPFLITCGLRTPESNLAAGGVHDSAHLRGLAVDLRATNSSERFKMLQGLFGAGFRRIGVYGKDGHIHVDRDESLPQNVFWVNP